MTYSNYSTYLVYWAYSVFFAQNPLGHVEFERSYEKVLTLETACSQVLMGEGVEKKVMGRVMVMILILRKVMLMIVVVMDYIRMAKGCMILSWLERSLCRVWR